MGSHSGSAGPWGREESWGEKKNTWFDSRRRPEEEQLRYMPPRSPPSESSPGHPSQIPVPKSTSPKGRTRRSHDARAPPLLPPVASITGFSQGLPVVDTGSPQGFRNLGMQNILNPAVEYEPMRHPQRVSQSPRRTASAALTLSQTPQLSPRIRKRNQEASPNRQSHNRSESRPPRRLLTPKSPALRALSQGARGSPSGRHLRGMSNAPNESRVYTAEPGESPLGRIPPLPAMVHGQQGMTSSGLQSFDHAPASYANSTTSYSANTQGHMGSPSGSSNMAEREAPSPFRPPQRSYGPSQPAYQMELQTDAGATMIVPVEVDTQQASKLADEKRKRNAGASARFRQRRKEKEQAASQSIAELQKQLRDLTEERDYYMTERNFLHEVLSRTPGAVLTARPPSPRARRSQTARSYTVGPPEQPSNPEYTRHDTGDPPPAQRRRTSDYQPNFPPGQMTSPGYTPHYQPTAGPTYALPPPPGPPGLPDMRLHAPTSVPQHPVHSSIPPPVGPASRPPHYDPFRRDMNP